MLKNQKVVGLLALDSKETSLGVYNGESFEFIEYKTSGIHRKSEKGGSSQRRYERERDTELTHYFQSCRTRKKAFLDNHTVTAFIVGGPGTSKEDFLKGDYLHYELKNVLLSTVDTQSAGREAVREVLDKSCEVLKNMCAPE